MTSRFSIFLPLLVLSLVACANQSVPTPFSSGPIQNARTKTTPAVGPDYQIYGDLFRANYTGNTYTHGSVNVYQGSNTPIDTIGGSYTGFGNTTAVVANSNGKIWVASFDCCIVAFPAGTNGNATPSQTISGVNTGLNSGPTLSLAIGPGGNVWAGNEANFLSSPSGFIAINRPSADGNNTPLRWFTSPKIQMPAGIAFDPNQYAYITNGDLDAYVALAVFDKSSSGSNVTPLYILKSPQNTSGFSDWFAWGVAVDTHGSQCRTVTAGGWHTGGGGSDAGWPGGYTGRVMIWNACPPSGTSDPDVSIHSSVLSEARGVAVDSSGNIYVADSGANSIFEFAANAQGNASPIRTIHGGAAWGVALGPSY